MVIKTQTEYGLPSTGQLKKFPDLEAQKSAGTSSEERHGVTKPSLPALPGPGPWGVDQGQGAGAAEGRERPALSPSLRCLLSEKLDKDSEAGWGGGRGRGC